ncbi:hypothetical protein KAS24_01705, partial [Candidatus Bathyarchaeota archaeon]|nr:hypothetical protein [Candidatus Bathyarchaeota archaeon]
LVRVTQTLSVNETLPVVTFPLLSSVVDNFIVLDENQTVLDYEVEGVNLTVFTLGTTSVSVQYDTDSLTNKDAEVWTFLVDSPYNITVLLPEESTIVYLSEMPASIDTDGSKITLSLFPSQWEISYVFSLTPPAEFQISNLEVTPTEVKAGEEVTVSVRITNVGGQAGSYTLPLLTINQTVEETRTVTLEKGASTITEFTVTKQTLGTYNVEIGGLVDQFTVSEAPSNGTHSNVIPTEYLVAAAAAVAAILFVVFLLFRRRGPNIEKIFRMNPQLNTEEKDVIQFLAENEGKAFESQIREQFPDIPRTSLWRLVKRLEKLEIIKVKKIGLENQVELKK